MEREDRMTAEVAIIALVAVIWIMAYMVFIFLIPPAGAWGWVNG